jgi:hypothetical protein
VIVAGRKIRSVGMRKDIPIPQDSERTDLTGKQVRAAEGSRIAPGEDSNIEVVDASGTVVRRLINGEWK